MQRNKNIKQMCSDVFLKSCKTRQGILPDVIALKRQITIRHHHHRNRVDKTKPCNPEVLKCLFGFPPDAIHLLCLGT